MERYLLNVKSVSEHSDADYAIPRRALRRYRIGPASSKWLTRAHTLVISLSNKCRALREMWKATAAAVRARIIAL